MIYEVLKTILVGYICYKIIKFIIVFRNADNIPATPKNKK